MFDRARCLDPSPLTASPFVSMDALRSSAAGIEAAAVILECAAFWRIQILSRAESGSAVRLKRAVSFTSPCYDRRCYNSRIASPPQKLHRSLARDPPIGGLFDESPEHSVRMGVRGGAGRTRTSDQTIMSGQLGARIGTSNHRYERSALTVELRAGEWRHPRDPSPIQCWA